MSTYGSLMVGLDLGPNVVERARLAAGLADRFGAHLIGVAGRRPIMAEMGDAGFAAGAIIERDHEFASEELQDVEAAFRQAVGSYSRVFVRTGVAQPGALLLKQSRAADLVIVGRQGRHDHSDWRFAVDPGDIVLQAGRPVLVVPPHVDHLSARRMIVAWKDTREARRAVWDSLPLLREAEEVFVCAAGDSARGATVLDVREHLGRHGVQAETLVLPRRDVSVAGDLIEAAEWNGADLIVCGAYGHSRTREWLLGGVTRDLLDHAPVCCLMAH